MNPVGNSVPQEIPVLNEKKREDSIKDAKLEKEIEKIEAAIKEIELASKDDDKDSSKKPLIISGVNINELDLSDIFDAMDE